MVFESKRKTLTLERAPEFADRSDGDRIGTLTVLAGADVGATFLLKQPFTLIGRSPNADVTLEDDGISRTHARIVRNGNHYEVEDLGSTNGSFVSGVRVSGRIALVEAARIRVGTTLLRFAMQDELEREASRRIYELSVRDALTGLYNRRYFDERLTAELAYAGRHGSAVCVLLADIDHFKQVNDRYGHPAGDLVLQRVAAALRSGVRTEDVVARHGGEEFAMLSRGIDVSGARLFAERVRSLVERTSITWEGERIAITISLGIAHNHSGAVLTKADRLIAAADQALYVAKRAGRNRVEFASSPSHYGIVAERPASQGAVPRTAPVPEQRRPAQRQRYWEKATAPSAEVSADHRKGRATREGRD